MRTAIGRNLGFLGSIRVLSLFFAPLTGFYGYHVGLNTGFYGFSGPKWAFKSLLFCAKPVLLCTLLRHETRATFTAHSDKYITNIIIYIHSDILVLSAVSIAHAIQELFHG